MKNIDESVYIAPGAQVVGNVQIGKDSSVWYNAVVRGSSSTVIIGERTNIQDLACLHVDMQNKLEVGDDVTIGHSAIVHGCIVGNNVIIGMGAIVMNGAHVGDNCIIGAGALVTENTVVPDGTMAFGSPAKVVRKLTDAEIDSIKKNAELYCRHAKEAKTEEF